MVLILYEKSLLAQLTLGVGSVNPFQTLFLKVQLLLARFESNTVCVVPL
jgi:hypothetical protein